MQGHVCIVTPSGMVCSSSPLSLDQHFTIIHEK